MKNDGSLRSKVVHVLGAASRSSDASGSDIDTAGFEYAVVLLNVGTCGASATLDVTVETATTSGGSYSAVTDAAFAQITDANDLASYFGIVRLDGTEQFLQVTGDYAGTGAVAYSITVLLTNAQYAEDDSTPSFAV